MAGEHSLSSLAGITKRVYGRIKNAVPDTDVVLDLFPWKEAQKVGDSFEDLIILTNEQGITCTGSSGTVGTLRNASAMATQPARVTPSEYIARSRMGYTAAARAASQGPKSFAKAVTLVSKNCKESLARRVGIASLYGQDTEGIGSVAAAAIVDVSATTHWLVFTEGQWAPGIWLGSEGAELQAYGGSGGTTLLESGGSSLLTVTKVDPAARRVLVTATSGVITAMETDNDSYASNIFFYGAYSNDMVGAKKTFSNTTGTVFNISADTYGNWAGNAFAVGSVALTHAHVMGYMSQLQARGGDGDYVLLVSNRTFADLASEQDAGRNYDSSYGSGAKARSGFKGIEYVTGAGNVKVLASRFVKGGHAFLFPESGTCERLGSEESEWSLGTDPDHIWTDVADTNAAEMRLRADQAFFCRAPSTCAMITGIVNTFGSAG